MANRDPAPRLDLIPEGEIRRVELTVSCTDADLLPKVEGAGELLERDGKRLQRMFNGVLIEEGCYGGPSMTEIIRSLHGHHEPQEEVAFAAMIARLQRDQPENPRMVEFGSFWSFYSLWFGSALKNARMFGLEPDPNHLEVGRRNAALNGLSDRIEFVHGAIGDAPGEHLTFINESDGAQVSVVQHDLDSILALNQWDRADLVLVDVQGAETVLLERARETLKSGRVRFLVVSTHHHSISGDALTHQKALQLLEECGAHIVAEHSVEESFSGDGLIAVSFDPADRDMVVPISYARARDSLFGELEWDLSRSQDELAAAYGSFVWRTAAPFRRAIGAARRRG